MADVVEYVRSQPPASNNPNEIMKWALAEFVKLERVLISQQERIAKLEAANGS